MKPTEDAKMGNDETERLARDCETAAWCLKGAGEFETGQAILTEAAALIRTQAARIAELEAERDTAARDYCNLMDRHDAHFVAWQSAKARAEAAEAEVARLREAIEADCRQWFYYPIEMPVTADGEGPATVGVDAAQITYEVWDRLLSTHAAFDNLPDAINEAIRLNVATLQPKEGK